MSGVPEIDMSPDASPGQQSKGAGVRRVNNVPLAGALQARYCLQCQFRSTGGAGFCVLAGARLLRRRTKSA